jgi:galactokinase
MDKPLTIIAPGRVNLLGEHVDYNDGPVLPAAIDRSVKITLQPQSGSEVHLKALDLNDETTFNLDHLSEKINSRGAPLPGWAKYVAGVAWALQQNGFKVSGFEGSFTSNIPIGAGLSSSAAVEVGFAVAWQAMGGWTTDRMTLARLCQQAENRYVGVNCGLMDQFASAHGVDNHAVYLDTRSLAWRPVPLPAGTAIVIADSGVRHSLASSSGYNERRASCEEAVSRLKPFLPGIRALRDVTPQQLAELRTQLPEIVHLRARHVVEECARVDEAMVYLEGGDSAAFGKLMFDCHASLRDYYEVSCPELDRLVDIAGGLPGCLGARLTGAGFGGCTVNLVSEVEAPAFVEGLKAGYQAKTGLKAQVYLCHASQGAHILA